MLRRKGCKLLIAGRSQPESALVSLHCRSDHGAVAYSRVSAPAAKLDVARGLADFQQCIAHRAIMLDFARQVGTVAAERRS